MTTETLTGRALDAAVAERVLGWKPEWDPHARRLSVYGRGYFTLYGEYASTEAAWRAWLEDQFRPHSDIAAAWQVVEALNRLGYSVTIRSGCPPHAAYLQGHGAHVMGYEKGKPRTDEHWVILSHEYGDTAPEAICRAALAAVEARE